MEVVQAGREARSRDHPQEGRLVREILCPCQSRSVLFSGQAARTASSARAGAPTRPHSRQWDGGDQGSPGRSLRTAARSPPPRHRNRAFRHRPDSGPEVPEKSSGEDMPRPARTTAIPLPRPFRIAGIPLWQARRRTLLALLVPGAVSAEAGRAWRSSRPAIRQARTGKCSGSDRKRPAIRRAAQPKRRAGTAAPGIVSTPCIARRMPARDLVLLGHKIETKVAPQS
jgi:hypothetical protein